MHAQPGVYAVLLGSGVSTGAGVETGWGVVRQLVRRVAAASNNSSAQDVEAAWEDADAWWSANGEGPLGYSTILEQLAPTPAARQGLLAGFFEASDDDQEEGLKKPSKAHHAVAQLVKLGYVRVILTTNFDRLMEQALEAIGIFPQVVSRPEAVNGMAPLAHSRATLIKLHGDYKDLGSRNTPAELDSYPAEWTQLLDQVFDEYGLVISGWSADWDSALVRALENSPNRRYPLFWDARSSKGVNAQRLLAARRGLAIPAAGADEYFGDLVSGIEALERLSQAPLSNAMAVARLKRYLPDPVRRIDLHDLVMQSVDDVVSAIAEQPTHGDFSWSLLETTYENHFQQMEQLAQLLIAGVWHDSAGEHDQLWIDVLQRLVDAGTVALNSYNEELTSARLFPAFIAMAVVGITATKRDRDGILIRLATEVEAIPSSRADQPLSAAHLLHYLRLTSEESIGQLPRWNGQRWLYPASHLFVTDVWRYFPDAYQTFDEYQKAYRGFEYRLGLIQERTRGSHYRAISGEYVGEWAWKDGVPIVETAFVRQLARTGQAAWDALLDDTTTMESTLKQHRDVLNKYQRW